MDTCARALKSAAALLADGSLETLRRDRYAGWESEGARAMLQSDLTSITADVLARDVNPQPKSGRQERLENLWNKFV
jgi:xylose isomerase